MKKEKAVISVIGQDQKGIIAKVSGCLFEVNANIEDISQTIMDSLFTMIMMVDLRVATKSFDEINQMLQNIACQMKVEIRIQNQEIFKYMHEV